YPRVSEAAKTLDINIQRAKVARERVKYPNNQSFSRQKYL
ncbi:hypothetical protein F441_21847, partial [Phytophthora nicotianae CJ01A1]